MSSVKASRAANELFDALLSVPSIGAIASSALWTGIVVVIIIALIAAFVYRDSDELLSRTLRVIFWGLLFTSAVMLLRERRLDAIMEERHEEKGQAEVFSDISGAGEPSADYLLTRAGTDSSQSAKPIITVDQLAAVAARRGLVLATPVGAQQAPYVHV